MMKNFKMVLSLLWVFSLFAMLPDVSLAGDKGHGIKNVANPCNPCGKKMKNACNPCGGGFLDEPANPCAAVPADQINFFRDFKFKNLKEAITYGEKLANDPSLGNSGDSCNKCHSGGRSFKKTFLSPYPHYVKMPLDVVSLDQMINFCMLNPMMTKPLPYGSKEMTALAAYVQAVYTKEYAAKLANPCAGKNPCMANPCAGNPCGKR